MSAFIPLKRNCPVCSGARRDCRQSKATNLIHCRHSEANPIDYVFRGLDRQGFGMWADRAEVEAHSEEQREEWRRQRELEKQQRLEAECQQRAQLLSESERDREIRKVFDQLDLSQDHRKDLERRGLTDELVKAGGFRSVEQWQKLESEVSHRLAGAGIIGRSLITQAGYIWPVKNPKGQILGWQIRKDDDETGRFAWPTSATKKRPNGATVHLRNGELPIACHRPATGQVLTDAIELTEGTGVKPFITAQRLNRITLGSAGGNFASSLETFKSYLDELSAELGGTKNLILSPDAGAVANPNVMRAYRETHELTSSWGYQLKFRWWNQVDKAQPDIDELIGEEAIAYLSPEEFLALAQQQSSYTPSTQGIDRTITHDEWELQHGFGKRLRERVKRVLSSFRGFGKPPAPKPEPKEGPDKLFNDANQRLSAWQDAVNQGYQYILDASAPGLGKSHAAGIALPEAFEAEKLWYLSSDHRNPTTGVIEANYVDLPVRNNGLEIDDTRRTPNGNPFLVWPKPGEEPDTKGNCPKTDLFQKFRTKNLKVEASETSPICQTCKLAYLCKKGTGQKYGASFRGDRKNALAHPRIRAHADSVPIDFDFSASGIIWDEIGTQLKPMDSVTVTLADFDQAWAELEGKAPHLHEQLKSLRLALRPLLTGDLKQPYHGWDDAGVRALLPEKPSSLDLIISEVEQALEPDFSFLKESSDSVNGDAGISKAAQQLINRQLRRQAHEQFSEAFQRVALNWLVPFLKVWAGERGALRCEWQELIIFTKSDRHTAVAQSAKFNLFLDATISRERLALLLGVDPSEIYVVGQKTPNHNNLRVIHITGMGKLGKERRESLTERVDLLKAELKKRFPGVVIGDWQKFTESGDGQWFVNLRGSNEFQHAPTLAVFGNPCQNIGHLQALYQSLTGEYAPLNKESPHEGLQRFIAAHIEAEIEQALGRLRSHLRPDEELTFIFVGDYDLSFLGAPIEQVEAFQICREAGTDAQITRWKILEAIKQLHAQGQKLTQEAIATLIGKSQELISKVAKQFGGWVRFRKLLLVLLDPLYSGSNNFETFTEQEQDFINGYLCPVIDTTVEAIATAQTSEDVQSEMDGLSAALTHCAEYLGWRKFLQALASIPASSQANLLSVVMQAIGAAELVEVAT